MLQGRDDAHPSITFSAGGECRDLAPQVCYLQPLPSPTHEKISLKHVASWQSCTYLLSQRPQPTGEGQTPLLPGERMFRDGSWLGVCSTQGCMAVDTCPGSHQHRANTLALRKVMSNRDAAETPKMLVLVLLLKKISAVTPYISLLSGGKMWLVPARGCGVTPGCLADGDGEKQGDVLLGCGPIQVWTDPLPGIKQSSFPWLRIKITIGNAE